MSDSPLETEQTGLAIITALRPLRVMLEPYNTASWSSHPSFVKAGKQSELTREGLDLIADASRLASEAYDTIIELQGNPTGGWGDWLYHLEMRLAQIAEMLEALNEHLLNKPPTPRTASALDAACVEVSHWYLAALEKARGGSSKIPVAIPQ